MTITGKFQPLNEHMWKRHISCLIKCMILCPFYYYFWDLFLFERMLSRSQDLSGHTHPVTICKLHSTPLHSSPLLSTPLLLKTHKTIVSPNPKFGPNPKYGWMIVDTISQCRHKNSSSVTLGFFYGFSRIYISG